MAELMPHCTPRPRANAFARLNNARFNLYLRRDAIQIAQEALDLPEIVADVFDDERVRATIHFDFASNAQIALDDVDRLWSVGVVKIHDPGGQRFGLDRGLMRPYGFVFLPGDIRKRVDPNDVTLTDLAQLIELENEFERLVPRNIESSGSTFALAPSPTTMLSPLTSAMRRRHY